MLKGFQDYNTCSIIPFHTDKNTYIPTERKSLMETLAKISKNVSETENMKQFFNAADKAGAKKDVKSEFLYDRQGNVFRICLNFFFATEVDMTAFYEAVSKF